MARGEGAPPAGVEAGATEAGELGRGPRRGRRQVEVRERGVELGRGQSLGATMAPRPRGREIAPGRPPAEESRHGGHRPGRRARAPAGHARKAGEGEEGGGALDGVVGGDGEAEVVPSRVARRRDGGAGEMS